MATKKAAKKPVKKVVKKPAKKASHRVHVNVQAKRTSEVDVKDLAKQVLAEMRRSCDREVPLTCELREVGGEPFRGLPSEPEPQSILDEAHHIIYGDREQMYGDPGRNLRAIADYWTVHLKHKYGAPMEITTDDVCQMMISVKQARLLHNPTHRDSQVDTVGYQALMNRVQPV